MRDGSQLATTKRKPAVKTKGCEGYFMMIEQKAGVGDDADLGLDLDFLEGLEMGL